jgi:hypothetical protein
MDQHIDRYIDIIYNPVTPMGSSARFFGKGSRQDGKRFPGCQK